MNVDKYLFFGGVMARVLLFVHAEIFIEELGANPAHITTGREKIKKVASKLVKYIEDDKKQGGLTVLVEGEGSKYEDCFDEVMSLTASKYPNIEMFSSIILGGPISARTQLGIAVSVRGRQFKIENHHGLSRFISQEAGWDYVKEMGDLAESIKPNSFCIFFGGRQFCRVIGKEKRFQIGSVYELDHHTKEIHFIIKNAKLVV